MTAALGVAVERHYCSEKLVSVKLGLPGKAGCETSGTDKCKGCCKDQTIVCKTDDHLFQTIKSITFPALEGLVILNRISSCFESFKRKSVLEFNFYHYLKIISSRQLLSFIHLLRI